MIGKIYVAIVSLLLGWIANHSISATWVAISALIILATLLLRVDKISIRLANPECDMDSRSGIQLPV
jgi:hypothetical protein